jgi:hypothetical protein
MSLAQMRKAMNHPNVLGAGAAARRKHLRTPGDKVETVMHEFKRGTLHSGSGEIVTNRKQAVAIAMSEAGKSKPKKVAALRAHVNKGRKG